MGYIRKNMKKKIIKLTENDIKKIVIQAINEIKTEGIDVDPMRNVTMTDNHEDLVDTSLEANPTMKTDIIPNVKVWSIFKRKTGALNDGNPLLYALKGEKGYKLKNENEVKERIELIAKKFISENDGIDVTIMIPSTNNLNMYFANMIAQYCKNPQYIGNILSKMSVEEVDDEIFDENSSFRKYYGENFTEAHERFLGYCEKMGSNFKFHLIPDMVMRKVVEKTLKISNEYWGRYVDAINNKNILIVDDSITLGKTIKEACNIITQYYTPKSVTVLTLCSPLYNTFSKQKK